MSWLRDSIRAFLERGDRLLLAFCLVLGVMELGTGDSSASVQEDALLESAQEEESEAEESALQAASREEAALSSASSAVESALEESSQGAVGLAFSCYEEPQPITEEEAAATLDISLTMPTGPDISLMPTLPPSSICRLRRTMRTVSSDWFHAIPSFSQKFGVLRVKFMP